MSIDYPICEICEYYPGEDSYCPITAHYCDGCESKVSCSRFRQKTETLFDRITASPEVLAEEFVGMMYDRVSGEDKYYSMLTGEFYGEYVEAIAATVAKLKEVAE